MNAVPAKVAGVPRVVMVVPSPDGKLNPLVLAAAQLGGVTEIYRVGGAQAVAALAYGTATIAPVAKIVGPGNAYVAAAKRLVFGKVGIDMIAGPSEVLVIADDTGNADWIAADLLAQAEHDESAQSILITDSAAARRRCRTRGGGPVGDVAARKNRAAPHGTILARSSWCKNLDEAVQLANAIAAEHLEIMTADRRSALRKESAMPARSFWGPYAGGDRRLCRRLQPRAADRALGAVLLGPRRARLHEAHLDPQMRARPVARARTGGDDARQGRGAGRACTFGRIAPQSAMTQTAAEQDANNRIVAVTLDEELIGRSGPDIEHERAIAIYDLIEQNLFAPEGAAARAVHAASRASPATG